MLKKPYRLKKKKDFKFVAEKGRTTSSAFLVMKFLENKQKKSRIGFVVSKKISKKAVIRNKVKRRLREAVRIILPRIKPCYDIIFFTRPGIEQKDFSEIKEAVSNLLSKAGLIHSS